MKARVFVTLKPSVFDPQGALDRRSAAPDGLRRRRRRAPGQVLRARPEAASPPAREARVTEIADKLLANPVIESYRIESAGRLACAGRRARRAQP